MTSEQNAEIIEIMYSIMKSLTRISNALEGIKEKG